MILNEAKSMKVAVFLFISSSGALAFGQRGESPAEQQTLAGPPQRSETPNNSRIAPEVYERLANSADGSVYVRISLNIDYPEISTAEQRAERQAQKQEEVLALLDGIEFETGYVPERAVIYGHISAEGLNKLADRFDGFDWDEEAKLTAWDASSGDNFGISVSVDGDRAVAGAKWGEGGANNSGAAYVFEGLGDCDDSQTTDLCDIINNPSLDCCPPHDCCDSTHGIGCSDATIERCVCKKLGSCCSFWWTDVCVALVESAPACGACDPGGNGIIDTCETCPADFDGDGDVDAADLAELLGAWGSCPDGCQEDLNFDCEVDAADLAILLGCWGTCPCSSQQAQWNGGAGKLGAVRFAFGGGNGCLSLEEAVQMMGHADVGAFIEWVRSEVPPDWVHRVAQFLTVVAGPLALLI